MIKNDRIDIFISYRNITHYLKLGYSNAIIGKNLNIKVSDLPSVSHVRIDVICDICNNTNNIMYCKYLSNIKRHGYYGCRNCSREKLRISYMDKGNGSYIDKDRVDFKKAINSRNKTIPTFSEYRYKEISSDDYRLYKNEVRRLTKRNIKDLFSKWDGYDYYDKSYIKDNLKLSHTSNDYPSIDHKNSIYYGFKNGIPAIDIANISNLCITKRSINSYKRDMIDTDFNID